jgi:hypothetical protein
LGFCCFVQAGLELLGSSDPVGSASPEVGSVAEGLVFGFLNRKRVKKAEVTFLIRWVEGDSNRKVTGYQAPMAYACNPTYSGG